MGTPDFIRELRASAGHQLLFLPGVSAVVLDGEDRVLLGQRADTGRWAIIGGIVEPGEQPADCAVREVYEETAVHCLPERVVLVETLSRPVVYPNGDICQFMDVCLRCRATGGEARVNDEESLNVGWFPLDDLPPLTDFALSRIARAVDGEAETAWFASQTLPENPG
ncbi:NUDIX domain-containing protein [Streptomyces sp. AJS327]|uniref:NUDIX hydrolase n=1 Tax=Streptomyces sp. AJS327 TaxID=2545265 RepID=UPI0015E01A54|nr:NUDIX domain-containing protein [Streptomyces sp. AJS327]MBA0052598.1 NUDIX domain-containing protein [Streptomyces sp. AJS327]